MKILKKINITFAIIALVIMMAICSYIYILFDAKSKLDAQTNVHLNELTGEMGNLVGAKLKERFTALKTLSYIVRDKEFGSLTTEQLLLSEYAQNEAMTRIEILPYDENYKYGQSDTVVSEQSEDGKKYVALYVPVIEEEAGFVIKGTYEAEVFAKLVSSEMLGQSKNTFLISRSGEIVASENNIYKLESVFGGNKVYASTLKNHITSRNKGHILYSKGNIDRYICYANITYNDWYVISIVSSNLVEQNYAEVNSRGVILSVILFLVILFLMVYIVYFSHKYNLYKKIVIERRNIYAEETGKILFDYKVKRKILELSDNATEITGILPAGENEFEDIRHFLTEKSYKNLKKSLKLLNEQDEATSEVELIQEDISKGNYIMNLVPIKTKKGKMVRVVGAMEKV